MFTSDVLYAVIGALPDAAEKPRLVGLRRALHGNRIPGRNEWNRHIEGVLPEEVAERVDSWIATVRRFECLKARLPGVLADEELEKQGALREIVGDAGFRRALSQASSPLYSELVKWRTDQSRRPRRQSIIKLAKYVARAAAKTSPYSTFMASGLGAWTDDGPAVKLAGSRSVACVLEVNGLFLSRLQHALLGRNELLASLKLRVNPSATIQGGSVMFVGRPPREPIVTVPATPAVLECLRVLSQGGEYTIAGLGDRLADREANRRRAGLLVWTLVDIGLLEQQSPVADQTADPLGELADWLSEADGGALTGIVALMRGLRTELQRPAKVHDIPGHRARQRALGQTAADLMRQIELLSSTEAGLSAPTGSIVHDTAVFVAPAAQCSESLWRPALDELNLVRQWLAPFDPMLPLRLALGVYCRERFGSGSRLPFLTLHRAVQEELSVSNDRCHPAAAEIRRFHSPLLASFASLACSPLARIRELHQIRTLARQAVLTAGSVGGVVHAEPTALSELMASWPEWLKPIPSVCFYLQPICDSGPLRLAVNVAHTGYGRGRSRVLRLMTQSGAKPPEQTRRVGQADKVLAELTGTFAMSANLRLASAPYGIDYPFTVSSRPASQRIQLGELVVAHDPVSDLTYLTCPRLKGEVNPLHLGMMTDSLLPPAARLLTQAFGTSYYIYPSLHLLTPSTAVTVPEEVITAPRAEIGRIVIQRRRWVAPTSQVPTRAKGESHAGFLLRLVSWLRGHDIPINCFVRMWGIHPLGKSENMKTWETRIFDKSHKPMYIDFANWYLVMVFERMLLRSGPIVVFEEVLPELNVATELVSEASHVTEFMVEISE